MAMFSWSAGRYGLPYEELICFQSWLEHKNRLSVCVLSELEKRVHASLRFLRKARENRSDEYSKPYLPAEFDYTSP